MPQIITKQDVEFDEVRIQRRTFVNDQGQLQTDTYGLVGYKVLTDDPDSDYVRQFEAGPLVGANLVTADDIFAKLYAAIKSRESIP